MIASMSIAFVTVSRDIAMLRIARDQRCANNGIAAGAITLPLFGGGGSGVTCSIQSGRPRRLAGTGVRV